MDKKPFLVLAAVLPLLLLPFFVSEESEAADSFTYGSKLDPESKSVYDVCVDPYKGSDPMNRTWSNPTPLLPEVSNAALKAGATAAFLDHPNYFWLWNVPTGIENAIERVEGGKIRFIVPNVNVNYTFEMVECVKEMHSFASGMMIGVDTSTYDAINMFDMRLREKAIFVDGEDDPLANTAYGAIVLGKANHLGFAAAMKYCAMVKNVADVIVIPGTLHSTEKSVPHVWNAVHDGSGWYVTDTGLNEIGNTNHYVMKASNEYGPDTDYTISASHHPGADSYMESLYTIKTPEISYRAPPLPPEPTFTDKHGSDIMLIAMVAVLCVVMLYAIRRA